MQGPLSLESYSDGAGWTLSEDPMGNEWYHDEANPQLGYMAAFGGSDNGNVGFIGSQKEGMVGYAPVDSTYSSQYDDRERGHSENWYFGPPPEGDQGDGGVGGSLPGIKWRNDPTGKWWYDDDLSDNIASDGTGDPPSPPPEGVYDPTTGPMSDYYGAPGVTYNQVMYGLQDSLTAMSDGIHPHGPTPHTEFWDEIRNYEGPSGRPEEEEGSEGWVPWRPEATFAPIHSGPGDEGGRYSPRVEGEEDSPGPGLPYKVGSEEGYLPPEVLKRMFNRKPSSSWGSGFTPVQRPAYYGDDRAKRRKELVWGNLLKNARKSGNRYDPWGYGSGTGTHQGMGTPVSGEAGYKDLESYSSPEYQGGTEPLWPTPWAGRTDAHYQQPIHKVIETPFGPMGQ